MAFLERWKDIKDAHQAKATREAAEWLLANYKERYAPIDTSAVKMTWCNVFFTDIVQRLKLPGPFHWVDPKGNPLIFGPGVSVKGIELNANGLIEWFEKYGHGYGWIKVDKKDALLAAQKGKLVAVTWHSREKRKSGHIGVMLEDGTLAQAGHTVFVGKSIEAGFGNLPVEFWAYVEETE